MTLLTARVRTGYGEAVMTAWANDVVFADCLRRGAMFEAELIEGPLLPLVRAARVIVDVGAHIGSHTVSYGLINREAVIHAFEPHGPVRELLERNVAANGLAGRVRVHACAAGHEARTVAMARTVADGPNTTDPVQCGSETAFNIGGLALGLGGPPAAMVTLDSLGLRHVDLIKIDVEGAEPFVLCGALRTIAASRPAILFESNHKRVTADMRRTLGLAADHPVPDPFRLLAGLGYSISQVSSDNFLAVPL